MKLLSLFLLLQVLFLSIAPALVPVAEAACCAVACEEEEAALPGQEQHSEEAGEQCNPFSCTACCLLIAPGPQLFVPLSPQAISRTQPCTLVASPPLQPRCSIWHPPRLA